MHVLSRVSIVVGVVLLLAILVLARGWPIAQPGPQVHATTANGVAVQPQVMSTTPTQGLYHRRVQENFDAQATRAAASPMPRPAVQPPPPTRSNRPTATLMRGIQKLNQSGFQVSHIASISNMWFDEQNGTIISVSAGGVYEDTDQGFVGIEIFDIATQAEVGGGKYLTPIRAGYVEIVAVDASGTRFTLQTPSGVIFVFDRITGQFVDVPPSNYPTATPGAPAPLSLPYPAP